MRRLLLTLALAAAASPLAAQGHEHHGQQQHQHGAGGALPAGWHARLDRADARMEDLTFAQMGDGFHVTTGPAVILWNPANAASGEFRAHATFTQTRAPQHPEAYGLVLAGKNLDTAPDYFYFIVRQDGKYMVRHRAPDGDVHTLVDWTEHAAVTKADAQGKATNALAAEASAAGVRFTVNGQQVAELPNVRLDGVVGLRVNHNLDVHVSDFGVVRS